MAKADLFIRTREAGVSRGLSVSRNELADSGSGSGSGSIGGGDDGSGGGHCALSTLGRVECLQARAG